MKNCPHFTTKLTFFVPGNPSDSVKKKANGRRKKSERLDPRKIRFHKPGNTPQAIAANENRTR